MPFRWRRFWRSDGGAVAPTVALSLVGLIATGGLAFDYARLASLDTELQQAVDQAALAAVTQLDRADDSIERAQATVQSVTAEDRLASNLTRFANDGSGSGIEINSITFCSAFDDSIADTAGACTETTDPAEARFVWLQTTLRTANYAFTPIVGAISGTSQAEAVAGVESSICNIAPLFVCTDDTEFPRDGDIGKGLLMKTGAKNSWFPGNYGYLDFGGGNAGVQAALYGNGLNGCRPIDESNTAPGNKSATDAINTRFDLYSGGTITAGLCTDLADGSGCPDQNVGKDSTMVMTYVEEKSENVPPIMPECGTPATANDANPKISYSAFDLSPDTKGMPRDTCHYTNSCTDGNFGNKAWDRDTYFEHNFGFTAAGTGATSWPTKTGLSANATRAEVHEWEITHQGSPNNALDPRQVGVADEPAPKITGGGTKFTFTFTKQCQFRKPIQATSAADNPRRVLPIIAANCAGLNGASDLDAFAALRVFNIFLVEASFNRTVNKGYAADRVTDEKEIYGEILGPAETVAGGTGFQYYARNRPYLIR